MHSAPLQITNHAVDAAQEATGGDSFGASCVVQVYLATLVAKRSGWLTGWLAAAGWPAGWLAAWLPGWLADWLAGCLPAGDIRERNVATLIWSKKLKFQECLAWRSQVDQNSQFVLEEILFLT